MTTAITRSRRRTTPFDPGFAQRHADFWPLARAARVFAEHGDWPDVSEYVRAFEHEPPVEFREMAPKPRRARAKRPLDRESMYDSQIVRGVVPTRARCWHDFSNAMVWATFPRAKCALHARQHRAVQAWIPEGATRLPGARSREMDALALLDEGGVVQVEGRAVVFGHAIYEGAALLFHERGEPTEAGPRRVVAREVLRLSSIANESDAELVSRVDQALVALLLRVEPLAPESFPRAASLFSGNSANDG